MKVSDVEVDGEAEVTDWSAIRLFELYHQRYPARRVWIWSFDQHLEGYDSHPL